jgi:UDPglucose 6-dehydrogenase
MENRLKNRILVDGRNLYSPEKLRKSGWTYEAIGR